MRPKIHPRYYHNTEVRCSCGNTFVTGSTQKILRVEICSACHPFYTGKKKLVDSTGRVDRFKRILEKKEAKEAELKKKKRVKRKKNPRLIKKTKT